MSEFKLRNYQIALINEIKKNIKYKTICVQSACGSGKSIIQGYIAASATKKKNRVLFLVHRKELCDQIKHTFTLCGVDWAYCKVGMVQTITRRLDKEPEPSIIITDENHHCLASSYLKIYEYFDNAIKLGFTATPIRLGGKGLWYVYSKLILGPSIDWLIDNKYLAPFKLYSKKLIDTNRLHIRNGDYKNDEVKELIERDKIYGDVLKNYQEIIKDKKTIIYFPSIESSKNTAEVFRSSGYKAEHLDGKSPKAERGDIVNAFKNNEIQILCNVDLFGEGFDVPDCECVTMLRPTKSLSLYIQQSMRSMRYKENKEAIIMDHVGNCYEHGLPNFDFAWSLEDKEKKPRKKNEEKIKQCPECYVVIAPRVKKCPQCGHIFEKITKGKQVEDIILQEIDNNNDLYKSMPYSKIEYLSSLKQIIDFVEAKKYKSGVIYRQLEKRGNSIKMNAEDFIRWQNFAGYKQGWWRYQVKKYMGENYDRT